MSKEKQAKEIQDKIDAAALAEHIYEPKYGGKDHSGYQTMMKYEINYEREEAFSNGATFGYNLAQEEIERLKKEIETLGNDDFLKQTFNTSNLSKEEKSKLIMEAAIEPCSKVLLSFFVSCELENFIESMIINEHDGKQYVLTFQTNESFMKRFIPVKLENNL